MFETIGTLVTWLRKRIDLYPTQAGLVPHVVLDGLYTSSLLLLLFWSVNLLTSKKLE